MSRALFAYLLLILLPAGALAFFAVRFAESDYGERCETARSQIVEEADASVRRVEAALADAERRAMARLESLEGSSTIEEIAALGGPVGFVCDGQELSYAPVAVELDLPERSSEEWRFYRLSVRGGESYELARLDPERALDAYSFYLTRIKDRTLRDRLRFRVARAALGAERSELGRAILKSLVEPPGGAVSTTEEGLPIDVVAALRLRELDPNDEARRSDLARLVEKRHPALPTRLLKHIVELLDEETREGRSLERIVEERGALEAAVARHTAVLETRRAALADDALLLARTLEWPAAPDPVRAVSLVDVSLPPLDGGPFEVKLIRDPPGDVGAEGTAREEGTVERPVRLGRDGPILAKLVVSDPQLADTLDAFERVRNRQYILIGLLVLTTIGGGLALAVYLAKQRHLATLRSRLLANVSHELKTPITSIRMFSEMLAHDPFDEKRTRRFGELLLAESLRLSRIVTNLLDYSWFGRREAELKLEPVELGGLLARIAAAFSFQAEEKRVAFAATGLPGPDGEPVVVRSDPAALERIVVNLLDNALKYRNPAAETSRIELSLARQGAAIHVTVRDNGIGIRRSDRQRVFEEFYRGRYEDYAVKGAGLGLAISRRLARKLGGDILLESREGSGSTFTLVLPVGSTNGEVAATDNGESPTEAERTETETPERESTRSQSPEPESAKTEKTEIERSG